MRSHPNWRPWPGQHPVAWGAWHETPPVVTTPAYRQQPSDWLFLAVVRPA